MTVEELSVDRRDRLERAVSCARTRGDAIRIAWILADVICRLELAERELLQHPRSGTADYEGIDRVEYERFAPVADPRRAAAAGSGVTPPPDFALASRLTSSQQPKPVRSL